MAAKWKEILGAIAPTLGTALGGPLGGLAAGVLAEKLGLPANASEKDIGAAIMAMSPADYVRLKESETDYQTRLAELEVDEEKIHQADRASARDRQIKTGDKTPNFLAFIIVPGFLLAFAGIFTLGGELDASIRDIVMAMVGIMSAMVVGVVQYFFGSSKGSKDKLAILDRLANHQD